MPYHLPIPGMQRFKLEEEILLGSAPSWDRTKGLNSTWVWTSPISLLNWKPIQDHKKAGILHYIPHRTTCVKRQRGDNSCRHFGKPGYGLIDSCYHGLLQSWVWEEARVLRGPPWKDKVLFQVLEKAATMVCKGWDDLCGLSQLW